MFESDKTLLNKAKTDITNRRYNAAEKKLKKLADKKNTEAYFLLGDLYEQQNLMLQAVKYYQFAANDGNVDAMIKVADLCMDKNSAHYNYQKAILYYEMGSQYDNAYCLYQLGILSANFEGKTHDYQKAINYLERAINNGYANIKECAYILGKCYREENQDNKTAILWYEEAFKAGNRTAGFELAQWCEELQNFEKAIQIYQDILINEQDLKIYLKLAQLSQKQNNKREAISYYQQIINDLELKKFLNNNEKSIYQTSLYELGNLYYTNEAIINIYAASATYDDYQGNTTVDNETALSLYETAAKLGHSESLQKLIQLYQIGKYDDKYGIVNQKQFGQSLKQNNEESLYQIGMTYYNKQDYANAVDYFKQAADQGDVNAYNKLGYCYRFGKYVNKDYQQAFYWYQKSAEQNNNYGMYQLGLMYDFGEGVKEDVMQASYWYLKAYRQLDYNNSIVDDSDLGILYNNLGNNYRNGYGVEKDYNQAFELLSKAVQYGDNYGMRNFGMMYFKGQGIPVDYTKAFYWFEKAANNGNLKAMNDMGFYHKTGQYIEKNYQKSFYWFEKSASKNDAYGLFQLGLMYDYGQYVSKNQSKANEYYIKAIQLIETNNINFGDTNHGILYNNLGNNYRCGFGIEIDYQKAFELLSKACQYGDDYGMRNLGLMYFKGQGISIDYAQAIYWYDKAAHKGNVSAMNDLGFYYKNGKYVAKDYQKAFDWFEQSASKNDAYGLFQLGLMYDYGQYVSKNEPKANECYIKAIQLIERNNINIGNTNLGILYNNLGYDYSNGYGIEKNYNKAFELLSKATEYGNANSMRNLGLMYFDGKITPQDYSKAFYWYEKAANKGNLKAMNDLGYYHRIGKYVEKDYQKALYWLKQSAAKNDTYAMFQLGVMYDFGYGVNENHTIAGEWYIKAVNRIEKDNSLMTKAANRGTLYNNLGSIYYDGEGFQRDYKKAYELFMKAESYGNKYAMYNLGMMYKNGEYVSRNYIIAREYFEKAANKGHQASAEELRKLRI